MARLNGRTRQEAAGAAVSTKCGFANGAAERKDAAVSTECGFANGAAERVKEAFG